jgi:hypothetical protein
LSDRLTSFFTAAIYSIIVAALSSPVEQRCLANDAGKLAVVSSIFLSNSGEAFVTAAVVVVVDNNDL